MAREYVNMPSIPLFCHFRPALHGAGPVGTSLQVGFHGKDVDHIIKDLVEVAIKLVKKQQADTHKPQAQQQVLG